jgi:hypothetical protein
VFHVEHFVSAEVYVRKCMKWCGVLELVEWSRFGTSRFHPLNLRQAGQRERS